MTYGRIGDRQTVRAKIQEARKELGNIVRVEETEETVIVRAVAKGGNGREVSKELFRAISKGDGNTWIIMYQERFYPKD